MRKITVETHINETIHYALQQNCIPIISSLVIANTSKEIYTDLTIKVSFQPEFAVPYEVTIKCLKPNEPVELSPIRIVPSMEYLISLTEKIEGKLTIEVKKRRIVSGLRLILSQYLLMINGRVLIIYPR